MHLFIGTNFKGVYLSDGWADVTIGSEEISIVKLVRHYPVVKIMFFGSITHCHVS